MTLSLEAVVCFELPASWVSAPIRNGLAFAPALDIDRFGNDFAFLPLTFAAVIERPTADVTPAQFTTDLMARRVRQGYPDQFDSSILGVSASGYDWTDGVRHILSWFVEQPSGYVVEFCLARDSNAEHSVTGNLHEIGAALFAHVRWVTC
jgi:hypothetical protein